MLVSINVYHVSSHNTLLLMDVEMWLLIETINILLDINKTFSTNDSRHQSSMYINGATHKRLKPRVISGEIG